MADKQVVLITGCSSGIGRDTAVKLAKTGKYVVYATMRNLGKKGDPEKAAGNMLNKTLRIVKLDVTKEEDIVKVVGQLIKDHGKVDILVNNAAFGYTGPFEEMTWDHMTTMLQTNMIGPYRLTQEVIPGMKRRRSGHIINISSLGGIQGFPFSAVYSASKFALEGFTESLYPELKCYNVKIGTVCPGPVATNFMDNMEANKDPKAQTKTESPERKFANAFMASVLEFMKPHYQTGDEIADVIIGVINAENPPLRTGTSEMTNKMLQGHYADGVGKEGAEQWGQMLAPLAKQ